MLYGKVIYTSLSISQACFTGSFPSHRAVSLEDQTSPFCSPKPFALRKQDFKTTLLQFHAMFPNHTVFHF